MCILTHCVQSHAESLSLLSLLQQYNTVHGCTCAVSCTCSSGQGAHMQNLQPSSSSSFYCVSGGCKGASCNRMFMELPINVQIYARRICIIIHVCTNPSGGNITLRARDVRMMMIVSSNVHCVSGGCKGASFNRMFMELPINVQIHARRIYKAIHVCLYSSIWR